MRLVNDNGAEGGQSPVAHPIDHGAIGYIDQVASIVPMLVGVNLIAHSISWTKVPGAFAAIMPETQFLSHKTSDARRCRQARFRHDNGAIRCEPDSRPFG